MVVFGIGTVIAKIPKFQNLIEIIGRRKLKQIFKEIKMFSKNCSA